MRHETPGGRACGIYFLCVQRGGPSEVAIPQGHVKPHNSHPASPCNEALRRRHIDISLSVVTWKPGQESILGQGGVNVCNTDAEFSVLMEH